jgi:hypothetical protein
MRLESALVTSKAEAHAHLLICGFHLGTWESQLRNTRTCTRWWHKRLVAGAGAFKMANGILCAYISQHHAMPETRNRSRCGGQFSNGFFGARGQATNLTFR